MPAGAWTTPADVVRRLRGRWDSGSVLSAVVTGRPWQPIAVGIRGPSVAELGSDLARAQGWARSWAKPAELRVEDRVLGGRKVGVNAIPAKAWIDTPEQLWRVLGVSREVERFEALVRRTAQHEPALLGWIAVHPLKALELADRWDRLLGTVSWLADMSYSAVYLRQIDVPGVDTKFIEAHRAVLTDLLDRRLPPGRIDDSGPRSDFVARYGFRKKPSYLRIRTLGGRELLGGFTEVAVRTAELARNPLRTSKVYVVENEVTYLAFPAVPDAVVMLGEGYAVSRLRPLHWLADREVVYWGDLDTHGFRILDRMRAHFPAARSMLMDRATLLAHEGQWVTEPTPIREALNRLTPAEQDLYHDLAEDLFGPAVRLEQERVAYAAITAALRTWNQTCSRLSVRSTDSPQGT